MSENAEEIAQNADLEAENSNFEPDSPILAPHGRFGRTEMEQLEELKNHAINKMSDHMATHGCFRCARTFVRGFTTTGPNPDRFCPTGLSLITRIALAVEAISNHPAVVEINKVMSNPTE